MTSCLWTSFLRRANDVPWMPPELVGRHGIMSLVEWSGHPEDGRAELTEIRDDLAPAASDLSVVPFLFIQTVTDDLFAHGLRTYIKAGFAADLPDALIDVLLGPRRPPRVAHLPGRAARPRRRHFPGQPRSHRVPVPQRRAG